MGQSMVEAITFFSIRLRRLLTCVEIVPSGKKLAHPEVSWVRSAYRQGMTKTDVRFYISSMGMSVKRFARYVRGHSAIENTLHWCLDVTFREDDSRVRERNSANNLAWLQRFSLSLLKQQETSTVWRCGDAWPPGTWIT